MKNVKKWLALGLAAIMVLGTVACGSTETKEQPENNNEEVSATDEAKEPVTLEWWYRGNGMQVDTEAVNEAFNEKLQTYPGLEHVTVHFNCYLPAEYANAVVLAQSSDTQIDILNTVNLNFAQELENGTYLALDDLLAEHADLKNELPDWLWEYGKKDGSTYMVPNYQRAANQIYFMTPKAYADAYDVEKLREAVADPAKTPTEIGAVLEEYLLAVREATGENKHLDPLAFQYTWTYGLADRYDAISGSFVKFENSDNVDFLYTAEEAKEAYAITADWYSKGYIAEDVITAGRSEYTHLNMSKADGSVYTIQNGAGTEEEVAAQFSKDWGFEVVAIALHDNYMIPGSWGAGGNGITASCEHPEEAIRFLEVLNTEPELYNIVVYGLEGTHYEKIDETHIKTLEYDGTQAGSDSSYGAMKWVIGNTMNAYLNQGCNERENEIAEEISSSPDTVVSKLQGFYPELDSISSKLDQVSAVVTEYGETLSFGVMGSKWEATYDEFVKKLDAAGYNEIITELQTQLDAHLAK